MRMTRQFRCWHQGWVKLKQRDCGRTCATIVPQEKARQLRCGSRIHRIARRANTRDPTGATLRAHCKRHGYAGFDQIYEAGRIQEAACWAPCGESFTISKLRTNPRLRLRLWNASRRCMPSKKKSEHARQMSG